MNEHLCGFNVCAQWLLVLQAPLSKDLSQQEYWSRLPFPPPGDLPHQGIGFFFFFFFFFRGLDSCLLNLLHWQVVSLAPSHLGSAWTFYRFWQMYMITPPHYNIIQISYCSKHPQCSACPYLSPRKLQATTDLFTVSMIWSYVFP